MKNLRLHPLRFALACFGLMLFAGAVTAFGAEAAADRSTLLVVMGAEGEAEFGQNFREQFEAWKKLGQQSGVNLIAVGGEDVPAGADLEKIKESLAAEKKEGLSELWLVLVGHGTFDGKEAKFNLRGADLGATQLAEWLKPFARPVAVIDTSSSSAPFLAKLSGARRVVVTSTRSGYEHNYARFGKYIAEAMGDAKGDLDKDGQISLLEAFLSASHRTTEFYKTEGRLATEHALIDDNSDALGTPPDWFKGVRATKRSKEGAPVDGTRAHQFVLVRSPAEQQLPPEIRAKRDALELDLAKLRDSKAKLGDEAYYRELEKILLQIAALYDAT